MVKVQGDLKTYSFDTSVPKFNLSNRSLAEVENSIEYLLFVDHEEDIPMEVYSKLQPLVKDLARLVVTHADAAVRDYQNDITYKIAEAFRDEAAKIVFGQRIETSIPMRHDTTIDDEKVVHQQTVPRDSPPPDLSEGIHEW